MAKIRKTYLGGAVSTTTSTAIASSGTTTFNITTYTGWPYGASPFFVVLEPGAANEEKVLVTRAGATDLTVSLYTVPSVAANRGLDGTSAVAHTSGSTTYPVFTATEADEANELVSTMTTKGDLLSHGASTFGRLGVGTDGYVLKADSTQSTGLVWGAAPSDALKADLASPTFTGTPTLPTGTIATTQAVADNSTKVATTAFVTTAGSLTALGKTSGSYYSSQFNTNSAGSAVYQTTYYLPIFIDKSTAFNRIGFGTHSAWSGTGNVRLGIYNNDNTTAKPSTVVLDAGTVSASATGTIYEITISQTLTIGWYWLAVNLQTSGLANTSVTSGIGIFFPGYNRTGSSADMTAKTGCWSETGVAGAFATAGSVAQNSNTPIVILGAT